MTALSPSRLLLHQQFLAGYLVARVLPIGIGQGGAFGDDMAGGRLVVGRGRRDVDILQRAPLEETQVTLYLRSMNNTNDYAP